ncbi:MAG: ATP-binding protein [Candidatus Velthaea sp.]
MPASHGTIVLHVEDAGPPFAINGHVMPDLFAESGRGMFLVRTLARELELSRTGSGNRVSVVLPMKVA